MAKYLRGKLKGDGAAGTALRRTGGRTQLGYRLATEPKADERSAPRRALRCAEPVDERSSAAASPPNRTAEDAALRRTGGRTQLGYRLATEPKAD